MLLSTLVAIYGYNAKRMVSAISLSITVALIVNLSLYTILGIHKALIIASLIAVAFAVGMFFYRIAIAVSASITLLYAVLCLTGFPIDREYIAAVSLVLALLLYTLSRRRGYLPYTILGSSALAYFINNLTHATIAVPLAILVGIIGYLVQEKAQRTRIKYKRIRLSLKKHHRHTLKKFDRAREP